MQFESVFGISVLCLFVSSKSSFSLPYSALKDKTVALYLVKRDYNYNVLLQFKWVFMVTRVEMR